MPMTELLQLVVMTAGQGVHAGEYHHVARKTTKLKEYSRPLRKLPSGHNFSEFSLSSLWTAVLKAILHNLGSVFFSFVTVKKNTN